MRSSTRPGERPLFWVGSSMKDLLRMPSQVVRQIGHALGVAQYGGRHPAAKPWKGLGPGVWEVVSAFEGNAFRAVYTVRFHETVYVLHCFQKKSPRGARTAKTDVDLIAGRLKAATANYEARYGKGSK